MAPSETHGGKRRPARRYFGSVRKRSSGRYQASYWHEGQLHHAPETFPTKAEADAYLSSIQTDLRRGTWIDPAAGRLTVAELGRRWLAHDPTKRTSSRQRDEAILRLHVEPALGHARVPTVTRTRIQEVVNGWRTRTVERPDGTSVARTVAARTVRRQYDVLRALFTYALENDLIARSPCRGIKLPDAAPIRRRPLSAEDVAAIAEGTPERYRPMVWIGAVLGLRWGELAGLRVGDVDLVAGRVVVSMQLGRDGELGEPKSDAGRRALAIPGGLVDLLTAHLEQQGLSDPAALLFQRPEGGPLDYSNWRRRVWLPVTSSAGLEGVETHDLRRAAATALVRLGVDVKTAQVRLGHSDPRLTIGLYAQAESDADRAAADQLGERFFPGANGREGDGTGRA